LSERRRGDERRKIELTGSFLEVSFFGFVQCELETAENLVPHIRFRFVQTNLDDIRNLFLDVTLFTGLSISAYL